MGLSSIADHAVPASLLWIEAKIQKENGQPYYFKHIWSGRPPRAAMKEVMRTFEEMTFEIVRIEFIRRQTGPRRGHEIGLRLTLRPGKGCHLSLKGGEQEWDKDIWLEGKKE